MYVGLEASVDTYGDHTNDKNFDILYDNLAVVFSKICWIIVQNFPQNWSFKFCSCSMMCCKRRFNIVFWHTTATKIPRKALLVEVSNVECDETACMV